MEIVYDVIIMILMSIWVLIIPSILISLILLRKVSFESFMLSFSINLIFLPFFTYYLNLLSGNFISRVSILVVVSIINLILISVIYFKNNKLNTGKAKLFMPAISNIPKQEIMLVFFLLIVMLFSFTSFSYPPGQRYNCPDNWAYKNLKSDYIYGFGNRAFEEYASKTTLEERVVPFNHILFNRDLGLSDIGFEDLDYYKIMSSRNSILGNYKSSELLFINDEPYSIGIHSSFFLSLFNFLGWRILFTLIMTCSSFIIFILIRYFTKGVLLAYLSIFLINTSFIASMYNSINVNYLAMLVVLLILYLLIVKIHHIWSIIIAGAAYGILGGIRPISLLFAPAFLIFLLYYKKNKLFLFGISSLIFVSPVMIINFLLYGNPFQFPGFLFYPYFTHSFFGLEFKIKALLNFPFISNIVRSAWFPYPMMIYLPLVLVKNLGLILFSSIFFGFNQQKKKINLLLYLSLSLFLFFMLFNENWEDSKTTLFLLVLPQMIILSVLGLNYLLRNISNVRVWIKYLLLVMFITLIIITLTGKDFPLDERSNIIEAEDFRENKVFISSQKEFLSSLSLFPFVPFSKYTIEGLDKDWFSNHYLPPVIERFLPCIKLGDYVSRDMFFRSKDIYFIPAHIEGDSYSKEEGIDYLNLSYGNNLSIRDVSVVGGCYTFDLYISQGEESLDVSITNISNRDHKVLLARRVIFDTPASRIFTITKMGEGTYLDWVG